MAVYYNEIEPFAAEWLRRLIAANLLPAGDVDDRSIMHVAPGDLAGYGQCHFFAGIGIWAYALQAGGWQDRNVWTGSCPCQPFSSAGKGVGFADERHLWPAWFHLIGECRPASIFGEQVASKDGFAWLDLVQADLEGVDYACGAVPFPAAGVGAPQGRHRTYFVAHAGATGRRALHGTGQADRRPESQPDGYGNAGIVARTYEERLVEHAQRNGRPIAQSDTPSCRNDALRCCYAGSMDSTPSSGRTWIRTQSENIQPGQAVQGAVNGFWAGADWLRHRDGKYRPVEPGTFPLDHGHPGRVGLLRAYGNALCAPQAVAFVQAALEVMP